MPKNGNSKTGNIPVTPIGIHWETQKTAINKSTNAHFAAYFHSKQMVCLIIFSNSNKLNIFRIG